MAEEKLAPRRDNLTAEPKPVPERTSVSRCENTELERRVLAHERILQALIAHMAETEPKFLARLNDTFCVSQQMTRCEHDYTDTASYAEEFIRSVIRLGDMPVRKSPETVRDRQSAVVGSYAPSGDKLPSSAHPQFQVRHVGGVWQVRKDGSFLGDYTKKEHASAAVELARSATVQST